MLHDPRAAGGGGGFATPATPGAQVTKLLHCYNLRRLLGGAGYGIRNLTPAWRPGARDPRSRTTETGRLLRLGGREPAGTRSNPVPPGRGPRERPAASVTVPDGAGCAAGVVGLVGTSRTGRPPSPGIGASTAYRVPIGRARRRVSLPVGPRGQGEGETHDLQGPGVLLLALAFCFRAYRAYTGDGLWVIPAPIFWTTPSRAMG